MRVMVLYRPWLPSLRAQSLQVLHSAHALAARGHRVRVHYRPLGGDPLALFGLQPLPTLELVPLPRHNTAASLAMRWAMLRWDGVFLAREKRLALDLLRLRPRARLVLEAHELDSALAEERGEPPDRWLDLEGRVLQGCSAVIANCEGVANAIGVVHRIEAHVIHNAAPPMPHAHGSGLVYAGSLGPGKDLETVARAASRVGGIDLVGPAEPRRLQELQRLARGALHWRGEVLPRDLPAVLGRYGSSVVPLGTGLFGREFTSPLKVWTLLQAGLPFAGADVPALHRVAPGAFLPYRSGEVDSLVEALQRLQEPAVRTALLQAARPRSWAERALEVEEVLRAC